MFTNVTLMDLWGAMVRQSRRQTNGEVNFLGDPQYLGAIDNHAPTSAICWNLSEPVVRTLTGSKNQQGRDNPQGSSFNEPLNDYTHSLRNEEDIVWTAARVAEVGRNSQSDYTIRKRIIINNTVISIRIDLSHMDAPDPANLYYGWVFFEALGVKICAFVKQFTKKIVLYAGRLMDFGPTLIRREVFSVDVSPC